MTRFVLNFSHSFSLVFFQTCTHIHKHKHKHILLCVIRVSSTPKLSEEHIVVVLCHTQTPIKQAYLSRALIEHNRHRYDFLQDQRY